MTHGGLSRPPVGIVPAVAFLQGACQAGATNTLEHLTCHPMPVPLPSVANTCVIPTSNLHHNVQVLHVQPASYWSVGIVPVSQHWVVTSYMLTRLLCARVSSTGVLYEYSDVPICQGVRYWCTLRSTLMFQSCMLTRFPSAGVSSTGGTLQSTLLMQLAACRWVVII